MALIGSVPGQKKKKKKDLKIGERLKNFFKNKKKGSKMSLLGDLPGEENNTPYTETAKRFNNKNVKKKRTDKPLTKAQIRFKKRVSEGKSGLTGGPKGETIAEYRARQKKRVQDAAKKRNEQFKKTGKSTIKERREAAKKRIQEAARKRNADFKAKRKLKIKNKKKKK